MLRTMYEASITQIQLRFYDTHVNNPTAGCMVCVQGCVGFMYAIWGKGFYRHLMPVTLGMMDKFDLDSLEGIVTPPHFRLLRRHYLRAKFLVSGKPEHSFNREMVRVFVTKPSAIQRIPDAS